MMKKRIIKSFDKMIVTLLGMLGMFNSCERGCMVPMYGMYAPEYDIRGVVTDKTNNKPINNIRIIKEVIAPFELNDTLYTDLQGKYKLVFSSISSDVHLKVEDIDDEENGGEFETQEIDIKITDADIVVKSGKCENIQEKFAKTQNIKLEKKK